MSEIEGYLIVKSTKEITQNDDLDESDTTTYMLSLTDTEIDKLSLDETKIELGYIKSLNLNFKEKQSEKDDDDDTYITKLPFLKSKTVTIDDLSEKYNKLLEKLSFTPLDKKPIVLHDDKYCFLENVSFIVKIYIKDNFDIKTFAQSKTVKSKYLEKFFTRDPTGTIYLDKLENTYKFKSDEESPTELIYKNRNDNSVDILVYCINSNILVLYFNNINIETSTEEELKEFFLEVKITHTKNFKYNVTFKHLYLKQPIQIGHTFENEIRTIPINQQTLSLNDVIQIDEVIKTIKSNLLSVKEINDSKITFKEINDSKITFK